MSFEWAKKELELIGALDDFHEVYEPYLKIFSNQGHSGGSASIVLPILCKLLNKKPLSPLTSDCNEWRDVSKESGYPLWQNKRDSEAFSKDGGKTFVMLDDPDFKNYFKNMG